MKHRLIRGVAAFAVIAVFMPAMAMAAQYQADKSGTVSINEAVNDDLYAAGATVTIGAPVSGDVVSAGGTVFVNSTVGESVLAGGGTITVMNNVSDDVRVVGGNVFINGTVGHDVIVLGGQVVVASTATIGRDLVVLGGNIMIDGVINGNLYVRGGDVSLNGRVMGSADVSASTVNFGSKAGISGKLVYSAPSEVQNANSIAAGGVEYKKMTVRESKRAGGAIAAFLTIGFLIKIVTIFVLALIFAALFKKRTMVLTQNAMGAFGHNLLYGFAAMVLVPIAALILLVTVIGAPLSVIAMCAYGILMALAGIFAPMLIGSWIWKLVKKSSDYPVNIYSILVGIVVFALAGCIPIIGWAFGFVFVLAALGALTRAVMSALQAAQGDTKRGR